MFGTLVCKGQPVGPGDLLPDITLKNIFNDSKGSIRLSDLKGKLVIFDFWSIHCGGCIASFARLDSLQKKFHDRMQILFINEESKEETSNFFAQRKKLCLPGAPFITADSFLNKLFPHQGVPYSVWIDSTGKFLYSTQGYNTADWSVSKYFAGGKPNVTAVPKKEYIHGFIAEKWQSSTLYGSYITRYIPGINLETSDDIKGCLQLIRSNASVIELYKTAFSEYTRYDFDRPGRLQLNLKNTFPYVRPNSSDANFNYWLEHYCYNYHLLWPEQKKEQFYKTMQLDLRRYFGLAGKVASKKVNCLSLVRTTKQDRLKTKGGKPFINLYVVTDEIYPGPIRKVVNQPFKKFAERLEVVTEFIFKKPFIDETDYHGNIDFEIDGELWDNITLPKLKEYLKKYGLDLIEKPCVLPVLLISE